ncbi:endothelin-converting enzyme 2-like [Amblyomma americanum]
MVLRVAPKPPNRFCQTEGCIRHARLLTVDLNQSIDPCQNFSAYVCSSWFTRQSADYLHYSKSAMDDVRKSWFPSFHDMLRDGSRTLHAGRKPFLMYSICVDKPSQYGSDIKKFREFQDTLRVPWPEAPEARGARALDVLMTLAFKWQVPIWLRIREPRSASALSWRFFLDPGPLIPLMRQHHLSSRPDEYVRYWTSFYNHLAHRRDKPALDHVAIRAMYAMEGDVLNNLYAARMPPVLQPLMTPVASIGTHTPSLQSEQWLQALKQLELDPETTARDLVLLSDAGFFRTFGQVFAKYSNAQLMELIAWTFVQLCAPAADYRLLVIRYGTDTAANKYKPYFCERFVESLYSLLVVALYSVTHMSRQQRAFVDAGFDSLVSAAATMANATPWMDEASRLLAAEKLASTRLRLWPPDRYLENGTLEELYGTFPSAGVSFVDYWVTASRSTATKYQSLADADAFGYPVNYALPYHYYDGPLRTVRVAVGAATSPLYYTDGTKAMFYGGLGFLMALSLVKALDSQGLKWHPNGTFGDSFLSRNSTAAFADKDACVHSSPDSGRGQRRDSQGTASGREGSSVFPEIPALEVAYAAYRASVLDAKDDISQRLPAGLSGDQAFFMTLCYMTCSRERGVDCNKAVRNFAPFADAFHCARGTAMNPESKCSFFGPR